MSLGSRGQTDSITPYRFQISHFEVAVLYLLNKRLDQPEVPITNDTSAAAATTDVSGEAATSSTSGDHDVSSSAIVTSTESSAAVTSTGSSAAVTSTESIDGDTDMSGQPTSNGIVEGVGDVDDQECFGEQKTSNA